MIIKNARLPGKEGLWQIEVDNGKMARITVSGNKPVSSTFIDAEGGFVLLPFIEPHLDTTLTAGGPIRNVSGTLLFKGIERWSERK